VRLYQKVATPSLASMKNGAAIIARLNKELELRGG
jgi:hypothetical protein